MKQKPTATVSGSVLLGTNNGAMHVSRRPKSTIVMFSGGIDSAYTLVKLLTETSDEVIAHHIHFINYEDRHKIEAERTRKIVEICQTKYRPFVYSESSLDHRAFSFFGFDMIGVGFEAGLVAHSYFNSASRMPDRWMIGSCLEEKSNSPRWPHVLACVAANCYPEAPPAYYGFPIVSKAAEIAYLPREIIDLAWTCRKPNWVGGTPHECGVCQTCKLMTRIRSEEKLS